MKRISRTRSLIFSLFLLALFLACGKPELGNIEQKWDLSCYSKNDCYNPANPQNYRCANSTTTDAFPNICMWVDIYSSYEWSKECTHPDQCNFLFCGDDQTSSTGYRCRQCNTDQDCQQWNNPKYQKCVNDVCTTITKDVCNYNLECGNGMCILGKCSPPFAHSSYFNISYTDNGFPAPFTNSQIIISGSAASSVSKVRIRVSQLAQPTVRYMAYVPNSSSKYVDLDKQFFDYIEFLDSNDNLLYFMSSNTRIEGAIIGNYYLASYSRFYNLAKRK